MWLLRTSDKETPFRPAGHGGAEGGAVALELGDSG